MRQASGEQADFVFRWTLGVIGITGPCSLTCFIRLYRPRFRRRGEWHEPHEPPYAPRTTSPVNQRRPEACIVGPSRYDQTSPAIRSRPLAPLARRRSLAQYTFTYGSGPGETTDVRNCGGHQLKVYRNAPGDSRSCGRSREPGAIPVRRRSKRGTSSTFPACGRRS